MKKLLLFAGLAAATLSLTNCSKQEVDYAGNSGQFSIRFVTSDTKTTNDGLSTLWASGDALAVFYAPAGSTEYSENTKFSFADEEAAANGVAKGDVTLGTGSYDWYAIYPYASQYATPENTSCYATIGSSASGSQTQNGLDSKAHLAGRNYPLVGKGTFAADAVPSLQMHQVTSVIAVKVKNTTSKAISVNSVAVTAPEKLVGGYYINFAGDTPDIVPEPDQYVSSTAKLSVAGENSIAAGATGTFYLAVRPFSVSNGEMTVQVIAEEGSVEKTKNVTANFQAGHIKTINVDFDDTSGPAEIITATIEEFLAASVSDTQWYQLTGTVSNIRSGNGAKYGNFDLTDETGTVYIYGLTATKVAKNDQSFASLNIKEGDKITINSLRGEYNGTPQGGGNTPAYFVSKDETSPRLNVDKREFNVAADVTSVTVNITGNVDWEVVPGDNVTVDPASGSGDGAVTISFPANTDPNNAKEYSAHITTDAGVDDDDIEIIITQAKSDGAGIKTATFDFTAMNYENGAVVGTVTENGVTVAFDKGSNKNEPKYYTTGDAVRVYGGNTFTVSADGKTVISVVLTFSSGEGTNEITTNVPTYADGTWTGEAGSVVFSVGGTSGHRRIQTITVKYSDATAPVVEATLESIAVSGQTTSFSVGDTFSFDGTVTATYSDGTTKNVTSSATVSTPDLSSAGTKEVTVSYTEGGVTKTAKYNITVNAGAAHAGTLEDPYTVADALIATAALDEGKTSSDYYYIKGLVSELPTALSNGRATYFISDDGTTADQMKVYNGYYIGNASFESVDQLQAGDAVVVYGKLQYYKPSSGDSELEISGSYIYELKRGGTAQSAFSAKASTTTVPSSATTVKVNVYGNVDWTAAVTTPGTIDKSSGSGQGVITVSIPEYTDTEKDRAFVVTVATPGFDSIVITIWQQKKDASGAVTITGASALSAGAVGTANEAQEFTVEGISVSISKGAVTSDQIRVYKENTITITAPTGKNLKKVVFNCTASGTNNYGPGCFAEHDGYSVSEKVGTWEGSSNSLTLTASGGQVRATSIVVSLE